MYRKGLDLKVEHKCKYVSFLDLDITIKDFIFVYKIFTKTQISILYCFMSLHKLSMDQLFQSFLG